MLTDAKRFGKGHLTHKHIPLDTSAVPADHIRIAKGITLCNRYNKPLPVTISFAETDVIHKYEIPCVKEENTITIPFIDQVLEAGERITGNTTYVTETDGTATGGTATTLTDTSQTWSKFQWIPEHFIRIVDIQSRTVSSNTADTITVSSPWAILPSTQNYFELYKPGTATSTTSTTLSDTTQVWNLNMWAGFYLRVIASDGSEQIAKIVSNTSNVLTIETEWSTPESTTSYEIFKFGYVSSCGESTLTDVDQSWNINQFNTFTVRMIEEQIRAISSHSGDTITVSEPWNQNPGAGTSYEIFKNWITYMISGRELAITE